MLQRRNHISPPPPQQFAALAELKNGMFYGAAYRRTSCHYAVSQAVRSLRRFLDGPHLLLLVIRAPLPEPSVFTF